MLNQKKLDTLLLSLLNNQIIRRNYTVTPKSAIYYEEEVDITVSGYKPISVSWSANQIATNIYRLEFLDDSRLAIGRSYDNGGSLSANTVTLTVTYIKTY